MFELILMVVVGALQPQEAGKDARVRTRLPCLRLAGLELRLFLVQKQETEG